MDKKVCQVILLIVVKLQRCKSCAGNVRLQGCNGNSSVTSLIIFLSSFIPYLSNSHTCREALLNQGQSVSASQQLEVTARQRAPLTSELHGQLGWFARTFGQLEATQQRPHS